MRLVVPPTHVGDDQWPVLSYVRVNTADDPAEFVVLVDCGEDTPRNPYATLQVFIWPTRRTVADGQYNLTFDQARHSLAERAGLLPTTTSNLDVAGTRLDLHDAQPEFAVHRQPDGDVQLQVRADGVDVRITIGSRYDDVSLLAASLHHLADDVDEDILDGWQDTPDEFDAYISFDRGRYHVSLQGSRVGDYPSREVAEIELARAMVDAAVFPNAWCITDHGNYVAIDEDIRRWHDDGGDRMAPLPGVQYQPGDRVRYADADWPYRVVGDWGPAGVEVHPDGDPTIRTQATDRAELRPDTD